MVKPYLLYVVLTPRSKQWKAGLNSFQMSLAFKTTLTTLESKVFNVLTFSFVKRRQILMEKSAEPVTNSFRC